MELTDGQRSAIKSFILYLFTFIVICFYGVTHALAYDFTNWTGSVVNKFVFKLSNDEYITHTSNDPFIWLFRPDVGATENFAIKLVGGELGGFTKEVTGSTIFQFALGYTTINLDENTTPCQWFKDFSNYTLEYSTNNGNSWADFNVSTLSCAQNDGFIVLSYSVTSPGTVNITNLSFSGRGNEARGNAISTIFTAFNSYPVDNSSNVIINQNNEIIYQNQELIDNQNKTNEKLDGVIDNQKEITDKIIESNETSKGILGKIKDLFNWFTDDDDVDTSGLSNTVGWLPAGPVDSILNLPLNMLSELNTALSKSCTPLDLTIPFVDKSFQLPCISTLYNQISGFNTLWTWLGTIVSVLMLYTYLLRLYKWVDDTLTFRENNEIDNWGGL